jgi:hypothetical protein
LIQVRKGFFNVGVESRFFLAKLLRLGPQGFQPLDDAGKFVRVHR